MAIKNISLGGASNWAIGDNVTAQDINDTFNAAAEKVKSLSAFWLNSYLYSVYDDFESYSVGSWVNNSLWTFATSGYSSAFVTRTATIASSTNAGGTGKELVLQVQMSNGSGGNWSYSDFYTPTVSANRHWFARIRLDGSLSGSSTQGAGFFVSIDGTNFDALTAFGGTNAGFANYVSLFVKAKGSNEYDVYVGGKLIRSVTTATPSIFFRVGCYANSSNAQTVTAYIDDVYYSASTITA